MFAIRIGSFTVVGGPIFVTANWKYYEYTD